MNEGQISLTVVEGIDQFKCDGDTATVERLLTEWRARVDQCKINAMADVTRLSQLLPSGGGPGPAGAGPGATPFRPRIVQ